jgi:hypothetical protein
MRGGVLAVALLLWACGPASAQGLMVGCGDPVGDWAWLLGGTVRFDPDGSATWSPAQGGSAVFARSWHCDGSDGSIVIAWQHGFTDRLRLGADGQVLSGTNQAGVAVEGRRPQQPKEAGAAPVDPALVGTWLLEVRLPSAQGPIAVWWSISADGSYVVDAGPFSHAGSITAAASSFDLHAATSDYQDSGRYEIGDWATIATYGQHGIGRWHRREPSLQLEVASINAQLLPTGVPAITEAARALARRWQPDALLSMIDYERPDSPNPQPPSVRLNFFSPSTGLGLWITVGTEGTSFFGASRGGGIAVPNGFLDLPQAWAVARQYGVQPPLDQAMLRVWTPEGGDPVLAWTVSGTGSGINVDAVEGNRLEGDLSGYIADYNAQWHAAVAGLRRLLARPHSSGPSFADFGCDSWSSSSGNDSSSSDQGPSGPDYGTASQNSWEAGDMGAYDRIQSGTPTGDDCYRYGC